MIIEREKIEGRREVENQRLFNFVINDIFLPVDPNSIAVHKEGLNWGGTTLRSSSSAKVVAGSGVFVVQLSLIFSKEMFLHLHRLVCQIKNNPLVYIENWYIQQSIHGNKEQVKKGELFAVTSFQVAPMQTSPGTFTCELDLTYANAKTYSSELLYKREFETKIDDLGRSKTFGLFDDEILFLDYEFQSAQTQRIGLKNDIFEEVQKYELAEPVKTPYESNAFVRYGNYLQVKSLIENFEFTKQDILNIFGEEYLNISIGKKSRRGKKNRYDVFGIHSSGISINKRKEIIERCYFFKDQTIFLYEEYKYLTLTADENKAYLNYISEGAKPGVSRADKSKRLEEKRKELYNRLTSDNGQVKGLGTLKNKLDILVAEDYTPYTKRPELKNVFFKRVGYQLDNLNIKGTKREQVFPTEIEQLERSLTKLNVVSNFSGALRNRISVIPISGSEFPTVQFLGSSEPIYQMNILSKVKPLENKSGLGFDLQLFERVRNTLQANANNFKVVPDSGFLHIDCFITRLLGSTKRDVINFEEGGEFLGIEKRFLIESFSNYTMEGSPGTHGGVLKFCESKPYDAEQIKPIFKVGDEFTRSEKKLAKTTFTIPASRQNTNTAEAGASPLTDKNEWYKRNSLKESGMNEEQKEICERILNVTMQRMQRVQDVIKVLYGPTNTNIKYTPNGKLDILSKTRRPTSLSNHYVNSACDVVVGPNVSVKQLAHVIFAMHKLGLFKDLYEGVFQNDGIFIQYYHNGDPNTNSKFVHVDSRVNMVGEVVDGKVESIDFEESLKINDEGLILNSNFQTIYQKDRNVVIRNSIDNDLLNEIEDKILKEIEEGEILFKTRTINTTVEEVQEIEIEVEEIEVENIEIDLNQLSNLKVLSELEIVELKTLNKNLGTKVKESLQEITIKKSDKVLIYKDNVENETELRKAGVRYIKSNNKIYVAEKDPAAIALRSEDEATETIIKMLQKFGEFASEQLTEPGLYTEEVEGELERIKGILGETNLNPSLYGGSIIGLAMYLIEKNEEIFTSTKTRGITNGVLTAILIVASSILTGGVAAIAAVGAVGSGVSFLSDGVVSFIEGSNLLRGLNYLKKLILKNDEIAVDLERKKEDEYPNESVADRKKEGLKNTPGLDFEDLDRGSTYGRACNEIARGLTLNSGSIEEYKELYNKIRTYTAIGSAIGFENIETWKKKEADSEEIFPAEITSFKEISKMLNLLFAIPVELESWYTPNDDRLNEAYYLEYNIENDKEVFTNSGNKEDYVFVNYNKSWSEFKNSADETKKPISVLQWEAPWNIKYTLEDFFSKEELLENQNKKIGYLQNIKQNLIRGLLSKRKVRESLGLVNQGFSDSIDLNAENAYPDIALPSDPSGINRNLNVNPWFYFYNIGEEQAVKYQKLLEVGEKNIESIIKNSLAFERAIEEGLFVGQVDSLNQDKQLSEFLKGDIIAGGTVRSQAEGGSDNALLSSIEDELEPIGAEDENGKAPNVNGLKIKNQMAQNLKFEEVFGPKYDRKNLKKIESAEWISNEGNSVNFNQPYDEKYLIEASKDSARNFLKGVKSFKNAYPTFKLYIIEEDAIESEEYYVYDDFYTFNGVKSFTFYNNKKLAATTAQISLQNISGILDGSKPYVVRDVDIKNNLLPEEETAKEINSIESIIMRPGVNVQLRVGYDSNPNNLKVLFSGRITEVSWSSQGDACDIIAQSFGVELVAKKYGIGKNDPLSKRTYYNTHSLLGSLALSEDLKHFGHYKKGRVFQIGEAKDLVADLEDYKNDTFFNFPITSWLTNFATQNKFWIAGATAVGFVALDIFGGKAFRSAGSFFGKIFSRQASKAGAGANAILSASATRILISNIASKLGGSRLLSLIGPASKKVFNFAVDKTLEGLKLPLKGIELLYGGIGRLANFIGETTAGKLKKELEKTILPLMSEQLEFFLKENGVKTVNALTKEQWDTFLSRITYRKVFNYKNPGLLEAVFSRFRGNIQNRTIEQSYKEMIEEIGERAFIRAGIVPGFARSNGTGLGGFFGGSLGGALSDIFWTIPAKAGKGVLIGATYALILDGIWGLVSAAKEGFLNFWKDKTNPSIKKLLLSPQDDNLFPPEEKKYLKKDYRSSTSNILLQLWNIAATGIQITFDSLTPSFYEGLSEDEKKVLLDPAVLSDKRLSLEHKEHEYQISNSTIWDIFQEMALRHPGWIAAARPYGDGPEYRLFFGLPNQRYWSKPIKPEEAVRLNEIFNVLRGSDSYLIKAEILSGEKEIEEGKAKEIVNYYKEYWQRKTSERYVPFRKYHYLRSGVNIVNNRIVLNDNAINEVNVSFYNTSKDVSNRSEEYIVRTIRANSDIPEDRVNAVSIGNMPNIKGWSGGLRYGYSSLINHAKEMYDGEILIIGNPDIEPWDVCIINDNYLNLHGPVEVEAVTHMFSYETGFLTEIKPNALAHGNESVTNPSLQASLVFESQVKLLEEYPNLAYVRDQNGNIDSEKIEEIVGSQLRSLKYSGITYLGRLSGLTPGTEYGGLNQKEIDLADKIKESIQQNFRDGKLSGIESVIGSGSIEKYADSVISGAGNIIAGGGAVALVLQALRNAVYRSNGLTAVNGVNVRGASFFRSPLTAIAVGAGVNLFSSTFASGIESSYRSGNLGSNIFKDFMINKIDEGNAIQIIPVYKDNKPLLSSGYERLDPKFRFRSLMGGYVNMLGDGMQGLTKRISELEEAAKLAGYKEIPESIPGVATAVMGIGQISLGLIQEEWLINGAAKLGSAATGGELSEGALRVYLREEN